MESSQEAQGAADSAQKGRFLKDLGNNLNREKTDWKFWAFFLAALMVFLFAAAKLGMLLWEYHLGDREYQNLEESVQQGRDVQSPEDDAEFSVDFEKLKKINPDIAGWIRIGGLGISYPIVQGADNEYYLTHTFYRKENKCGSIFMEAENSKDFSDFNTFVYGHNMKDKSMFARLNELQEEQAFVENPEFYIYTPQKGMQRYKIYSCYVANLGTESFRYQFEDEADYAGWQEYVKGQSLYDTGIVPKAGRKTITLMTCTPAGSSYRLLVHGVLAGDAERNELALINKKEEE